MNREAEAGLEDVNCRGCAFSLSSPAPQLSLYLLPAVIFQCRLQLGPTAAGPAELKSRKYLSSWELFTS